MYSSVYVSQTQKYAIMLYIQYGAKSTKMFKIAIVSRKAIKKLYWAKTYNKQKLVLLNFKWFQIGHFLFQFESTGIWG